ncbi:MAG: hypothetical protein K4305_08885 [Chlorobium sp.]|uniref:hypothetical protein n=1 Tax=Chlorobium sp. TaxID=1095 RepID=UPI002F415F64
MNPIQKIVISIYAGIIFLMTLFPPFYAKAPGHNTVIYTGYGSIFTQHTPVYNGDVLNIAAQIDGDKLFLQYMGATLIAIAMVFVASSKSRIRGDQ